jgi:hypothetical protein
MGRPRKPSAIKQLEGNRSRREIPADVPLHGFPEKSCAGRTADEHFAFLAAEFGGAGVLKRADSPALWKLAQLWEAYCVAMDCSEFDTAIKLAAAWDRGASRLGLSPVDRSKFMAPAKEKVDPTEERFFKVTG